MPRLHRAGTLTLILWIASCRTSSPIAVHPIQQAQKPSGQVAPPGQTEAWYEIGGYAGEDSKGPIEDFGYCWLRTSESTHEGRKVWRLLDEAFTKGFSAVDTGFRNGTIETLCKDDAWLTPIRIRTTDDSHHHVTYEIANGRVEASISRFMAARFDRTTREWIPDPRTESSYKTEFEVPADAPLVDVSGLYRLVCRLPRTGINEQRLYVLTPDDCTCITPRWTAEKCKCGSYLLHKASLKGGGWEEVKVLGTLLRAFRFQLDREKTYGMDFWVSDDGKLVKVKLSGAEVGLSWGLTPPKRGQSLQESMHPRSRAERQR